MTPATSDSREVYLKRALGFRCPLFCYMDSRKIVDSATKVIEPVITDLGYSLVECEFLNDAGRWVLRLYIEKAEGDITIEDCTKVSRAVSATLDVEDVIKGRYSLEVSSPGINRPLKRPGDFEKYAGNMVRIKTRMPIDGRGNYYGKLIGFNDGNILVNVDGKEYKVPIAELAKARLECK